MQVYKLNELGSLGLDYCYCIKKCCSLKNGQNGHKNGQNGHKNDLIDSLLQRFILAS